MELMPALAPILRKRNTFLLRKKTKKDITTTLGEDFYKNHITDMYLSNKKIIIETKHIEAKTELNLIKKNSNILIRLS